MGLFFNRPVPAHGAFFILQRHLMANRFRKIHRARQVKNDEFYTQLCDIEKECVHYLEHFKDKIIYCNCDTEESNFVKYFKRLKNNGLIKDIWWSGGLGGDDFRSPESLDKLKQADVVITNPPFSLFIDFMNILFANNKKFLVLGNRSAVIYKSIFPRIKNNEMWFGVRRWSGGIDFITNDGIRGVPAIWFTNIEHGITPAELPFTKSVQMPKYDNADAVNVNRSAHFPPDYTGVVGVPITFLEWYNPDKFLILGRDKDFTYDGNICHINGEPLYIRLFVQRKATHANENVQKKLAA